MLCVLHCFSHQTTPGLILLFIWTGFPFSSHTNHTDWSFHFCLSSFPVLSNPSQSLHPEPVSAGGSSCHQCAAQDRRFLTTWRFDANCCLFFFFLKDDTFYNVCESFCRAPRDGFHCELVLLFFLGQFLAPIVTECELKFQKVNV